MGSSDRTRYISLIQSTSTPMLRLEPLDVHGAVGSTPKASPEKSLFISVALGIMLLLAVSPLWAGPPFRTDDPEPVEHKHWEFYTATQYQNDRGGASGTAPHFEVNYGVVPNVALHLVSPNAWNRPRGGPTAFGPGNVELGVKYRFIQESDYVPMVGTFPLLEVPTGSKPRDLGTGQYQFYLPLWLQKSWGPWTTYGGGGYWINPGTGNQNYWFTGWLLQRDITKWLTLGAEMFHMTPSTRDGDHETGYNIGAIVNFTENHHFICSAGTDVHGLASFFFYAAYLWTWGSPEGRNSGNK